MCARRSSRLEGAPPLSSLTLPTRFRLLRVDALAAVLVPMVRVPSTSREGLAPLICGQLMPVIVGVRVEARTTEVLVGVTPLFAVLDMQT